MLKLLLLIALVGGGLWWFARGGRGASGRDGEPPAGGPGGRGKGVGRGDTGEAMVRCEYCNTHVPQAAAGFAGKHAFCCEEHRAAAGY